MLPRKTVFIIGAGAGFDLNMPLGDALSIEIGNKTDINFDQAAGPTGDAHVWEAIRRVANERGVDVNILRGAARSIKDGITYSRSIDSFLNNHNKNEDLKTCAKIALVQTILESERRSHLFIQPGERRFMSHGQVRQSWLGDFMYLLQEGIEVSSVGDIFKNLTIINFNYDRCIEHFLFHALQSTFHVNAHRAEELIDGTLNIFHPYGVVGHVIGSGDPRVDFGCSDFGDLVGLSKEIRTFNEKIEEGNELAKIRAEVSAAERIIFLGFHFHPPNMALLKSQGGLTADVYGTAMERSDPDMQILAREIGRTLGRTGGIRNYLVRCDCKRLFHEYQTTWMTG
jgi:hypothetical protein